MDKQNWPQEPWRWDETLRRIVDANDKIIEFDGCYGNGMEHRIMDRWLACINACVGIPTEELSILGPRLRHIEKFWFKHNMSAGAIIGVLFHGDRVDNSKEAPHD